MKLFIPSFAASFLLFLCVSYHAQATHIVGAEMSYRNIGGNTFEFTLNIFRDCQGIPVQPNYRIDYSSLNCNIQGNFTVNMDPSLTTEVSPVCPQIPTICSGGTQDGIQKYVFKGTFTLPQACTDWTFSWRECNRNKDITTITNPDAQCLYIESKLNSVAAPTNNSPTFNNPPVSILCTNQLSNINPGTSESNGDSLVFTAVTPKTGKFKDVVYLPPFSSGSPLTSSTGYIVNRATGDIELTPSVINQVTVIAVRVDEYRNGVLIGSTIRDIQLITKDCTNNNPILSGIDKSTSDTRTVCAGTQVCFEIFGSDIDIGQKLSMTWDNSLDPSRASFQVVGDSTVPKGRFCFKTNQSDIGLNFFTVTLRDDFCPISGVTTKSYKIIVTPSPIITATSPVSIACNATTTLTPAVTRGTVPYLYKWNTGATTPSVTVGTGTYTLVVTDAQNCRSSRQIEVLSGVRANFVFKKICPSRTIVFTDSSKSISGTINSWRWDFGEPSSGVANTSILQNPSHSYAAGGFYNVKLVVRDNNGCVDSIIKKVRVCDLPIPNFTVVDSCQNIRGITLGKFITIVDQSTANTCGIIGIRIRFGNTGASYSSPPLPIYFPRGLAFPIVQPDTGWMNIEYTIINEDSCQSTIIRPFHVVPQPIVDIVQDSYYFSCNDPDTVLNAVITSNNSRPPYSSIWNTGTPGLNLPINQAGDYSITVRDQKGCIDRAGISVMYPIESAYTNTPYCEPSDPVRFIESATSRWKKVRWDWDFGDGNVFSTTNPSLKDPFHIYSQAGTYDVKLTVHDSTGCFHTATAPFYYELPDNHFVVQPSPFCIGQTLTLESPRGLRIDSLIWNMGNIDTLFGSQKNFLSFPPPPVLPKQYYYYDTTFVFPPSAVGNTYNVALTMKYNNNNCTRNYSRNVTIFPAFDVEIDSMQGKQCSGDTVQFFASRKIGSAVTSWNWEFRLQDNTPPFNKVLEFTANVQNPKVVFNKGGNYFATLRATNTDGCEEVISDYGFPIVKLPSPVFCISNPCVSQQTKFFYFCSNFPEVAIDSIHWSFGDGSGTDVQEPFHIYADSGLYNVKTEIFNTGFGCSADTTIPTRIYLLPKPNFIANPVCQGQLVKFNDLSKPSYLDTLERWSWIYGDGGTFSTTDSLFKNPTYLYADTGTYQASLYIESKVSNCVDTITKPVRVYPNPKAGFSFVENELVLNRPILFTDESLGGVRWLWKYGDGDSVIIVDPLNKNPSHTYTGQIKTVTITQVVFNEFGCTDTLSKTLDLSIHLLAPNAFSPNDDGTNDKFGLVYKGIGELPEFVIFNRWGEKIFDAEGSLTATWDGKYKGQEQPLGVYVYYVKAKAFNGEEISLSGKITLVR